MAKQQLLLLLVFALPLLTCSASTVYTVGDTSGWDISTDLDSWAQDKRFLPGDVLWFQYSSYHNVCEVTRDNYQRCNATDTLQTYSGGNTTITLSRPGDRYFVCSNRLHCLGGMKLHVLVEGDAAAAAPANAPQAQPGGGSLPRASKSNRNPSGVPSSASDNNNSNRLGLLGSLLLVAWTFRLIESIN